MTLPRRENPEAGTRPSRWFVGDLIHEVGSQVSVFGWVASSKQTATRRFLVIGDRTGTVQSVEILPDDRATQLSPIACGSTVRVDGTVQASRRHPATVEILADAVTVLASPADPDDGTPVRIPSSFGRALELRRPEQALTFHAQATAERACRDYLISNRFIELHTPKISPVGSESGSAVFELPYYGSRACLIQSPQFYLQLAMAGGLDRVFEVGPVFRAEAAVTNRHASEFTCLDVEISWLESIDDLLAVEEDMLGHCLAAVHAEHGADIARTFGIEVRLPTEPIPRISYEQACSIAGPALHHSGERLTNRAEQALSKYAQREYGSDMVFVTHFPADTRPFYTRRREGRHDTESFDLLWRGVEVTSGCLREHRYDRLAGQAAEAVGSPSSRAELEASYLSMFRCANPPHGGFGLGLSRLMMIMLGRRSVRETSFVFRGPEVSTP